MFLSNSDIKKVGRYLLNVYTIFGFIVTARDAFMKMFGAYLLSLYYRNSATWAVMPLKASAIFGGIAFAIGGVYGYLCFDN